MNFSNFYTFISIVFTFSGVYLFIYLLFSFLNQNWAVFSLLNMKKDHSLPFKKTSTKGNSLTKSENFKDIYKLPFMRNIRFLKEIHGGPKINLWCDLEKKCLWYSKIFLKEVWAL